MNFLEAAFIVRGHPHADFSPTRMKRTMRLVGMDGRKHARRLVARRAVSQAGQVPGRRTGELHKSIKYRLSRSGWSVKIASYRTEAMKAADAFYPAFLVYGVKARGLKPRKDYIEETRVRRDEWWGRVIAASLADGVELKEK